MMLIQNGNTKFVISKFQLTRSPWANRWYLHVYLNYESCAIGVVWFESSTKSQISLEWIKQKIFFAHVKIFTHAIKQIIMHIIENLSSNCRQFFPPTNCLSRWAPAILYLSPAKNEKWIADPVRRAASTNDGQAGICAYRVDFMLSSRVCCPSQ